MSANPVPRKRRRPTLAEGPVITLNQIVDVATAIAQSEGFGAVRMRRVAQELSVWPQAVYNHVLNKDQLLGLVAEAALSTRRRRTLPAGASWEDRVRFHAESIMRVLDGFPGLAEFLISRPLFWWSHELTDLIDDSFVALQETGLDDAGILDAFTAMNAHLLGHRLLQEASARGAAAYEDNRAPGPELNEHTSLTKFLPELLDHDVDASYMAGLNLLIEGIRATGRATAGG